MRAVFQRRLGSTILWLIIALFPVAGAGAEGWYLLEPPAYPGGRVVPSDRQVVTSAPLREWTQVGVFDSARECEETKTRRNEDAAKQYRDYFGPQTEYLNPVTKKWEPIPGMEKKVQERPKDEGWRVWSYLRVRTETTYEARCIGVGDPRLR